MRKFEVEVLVTIEIDGDEDDAFRRTDAIMQEAWDEYHRGGLDAQWHFELLEGAASEVTEGQPYGRDE